MSYSCNKKCPLEGLHTQAVKAANETLELATQHISDMNAEGRPESEIVSAVLAASCHPKSGMMIALQGMQERADCPRPKWHIELGGMLGIRLERSCGSDARQARLGAIALPPTEELS